MAGITIGERASVWRRRRGMTLDDVARQTGLPGDALAELEAGAGWIDRHSTLAALATALQVTPVDLAGQPYPPLADEHTRLHEAVFRLRRQLAAAPPPVPEGRFGMLAGEIATAVRAARAHDSPDAWSAVPEILAAAYAVRGQPVDRAEQPSALLAEAGALAVALTRDLGYLDLCWSLIHHLGPVARRHPSVRAEEIRLLLSLGLPEHAASLITEEELTLNGGELAAAGAQALAAAGAGRRAVALLDGARSRADEPYADSLLQAARVTVAVEAGAYDEVPALADAVGLAALSPVEAVPVRFAVATAAARRGDTRCAVSALLDAVASAPVRCTLHPFIRDLLVTLSRRTPSLPAQPSALLQNAVERLGLG
ncbi:helix-turn-helix domain-containing protein [Streptomyces sp. NPDC050095]|uniref:helix-turn-helix domain-containing protein n=1 Tax=unclassified Streptomyces TaxID=2593676 RepID=UPI0034322B57